MKIKYKPVYSRLCPVPKVHKEIFNKEMECLVLMGVIEKENESEWGAPYFDQTKLETYKVNFIYKFRNLSRQLKRKPYKIHKIKNMLLKIEDFKFSFPLDLNMGYYHIQLSEETSNLSTIIIP